MPVGSSAIHAVQTAGCPETRSPKPTIYSIGTSADVLWQVDATLTSVRYGDVVSATGAGRIIALLTMMSGIAVFSTFTAFVATTFLALRQSRTPTPGQLESLIERLDRIKACIASRNAGTGKPEN